MLLCLTYVTGNIVAMNDYKLTVGIEVHAELTTKSKMFCGCENNPHAAEANANVCPVCMAHPGTLPTVNKEAVKKVLLVGKALKGTLATFSEFDRKNYFYPDIPKAYQLSQYAYPFVSGGELAGVKITRVHLEEDTARSQHDQGEGSLVDFNRAGVPLMELVTEPVIHDIETAGRFVRELQLLLRTMGVSNANMEKGEMRVEANISISKTKELGTKVEVKNLNSFKAMEQAIAYEVKRHQELIEKGEEIIQETRGWDEQKSRTFSQRSKEKAEEYRYFPDPDIPKFDIKTVEEFSNSRLSEIMPELPEETRAFLRALSLSDEQVEVLITNKEQLELLKAVVAQVGEKSTKTIKSAANYLTSDIAGLMQGDDSLVLDSSNAIGFSKLLVMVSEAEVTSRVAKDLLKEVVFEGGDPEKIAKDRGLIQNNSTEELASLVETILAENEQAVVEYKAGKETALKYLLGQGMKASRGSANPVTLEEMLKEKLAA